MASSATDIGRGTTITFQTGFFAKPTAIRASGISRAVIDTTTLANTKANGTSEIGGKTYMPSDLGDPGTLEVEFHFNPDTYVPLHAAAESVTVTFLDSDDATGATWACSGFMSEFSWDNGDDENLRTATATLKLSGLLTRTADA